MNVLWDIVSTSSLFIFSPTLSIIIKKDAVANELAMLEEILITSKAQINYPFFTHPMQVASTKIDFDQAESKLNIVRSKLKEWDSQINCLSKEQQKLQ